MEDQKKTWKTFFAELEACKSLEHPWTLVLRDPLANSFISSVGEDPRQDPRMQVGICMYTQLALLSVPRPQSLIPPLMCMSLCLQQACNSVVYGVVHLTLADFSGGGVQIEDYERSAEDDEHFGIDHLKAQEAAEASKAGRTLDAVPEEAVEN